MASTGGPEAEFHDPRRRELLQRLSDALPTDTIRPTSWACLWLCDIDKLEDLLVQAQTTPTTLALAFEGVEVAKIVPTWTQRKRPASTVSTPQNPSTPLQPSTPQRPSTPQQPSTLLLLSPLQQPPSAQNSCGQKRDSSGQGRNTRSKQQRALCHERDRKTCILTKSGEPNEVTHIYPFSMRNEDSTIKQSLPSFWQNLGIFWSKERVDAWYNAIFPLGTEVCQNLICLAPHAHKYWEKAYFALKPIRISEDKKRLDIQFFWLSSNPYVPRVNILQVPSLSALDRGPNLARLFNHETCAKISSGYEISLQTDDPVSRPLPDFRLLEMQWFLHRVTAMSGAAEPQDDCHDDDDNSDDDIVEALQNRRDMYMEDDWDMDIEEGLAMWLETSPERLWEERFPAQPPRIQTFGHMVSLRGGRGYGEGEDGEGEDSEGEDSEGEDGEGEDHKGEDYKEF
ncbi:hypothetical protein K469DRAFT_688896 [Zopfia rhizophila CBS 207.26]|uniref:HNH nuclease domain-containing protein n=1 Tax=Zopfia rhizophila CBS 207.26 TaxID=1314779 RepID=A0A6A6E3H3_9PEZI|nr:hypothetical protein K469DRAFT_688896 [Zopfia rhizophila CBS 207.26]